MSRLKVGVVGATGLVGEAFLDLLSAHEFPAQELRLFASDASVGQTRKCLGKTWSVLPLTRQHLANLDVVFFSSGEDISREWAPIARDLGAVVIDNSSAFRMDEKIPLMVPEINGNLAKREPCIIANPNCSTIQLVMMLAPLKKFGIESVRVSSYQAVSGSGRNGLVELVESTRAHLDGEAAPAPKNFAKPIAFNCIPQIGSFNDNGFSTEEWKIMHETRKILDLPQLAISAFAVRVPVVNVHAETVWVEFSKNISFEDIQRELKNAPGISLVDQGLGYSTQVECSQQEFTHVGRIHRDPYHKNTWMFWVVSDNLYKGAALNGLQIAEKIFA